MSALLLGPEEAAIEFSLLSFVSKFQVAQLLHPLSLETLLETLTESSNKYVLERK